ELCAETDFVSHRDEFKDLAYELAMQICAMAPEDKEELLEQEWIRDPEKKIKDLIQEMAVKTKENVEIGNFYRIAVGEE
ncbi:MAG: elongation factor Ts, partial [Patescibacteria group bacterium]|nr:elongation factor Ts [Patescibacteria group bacterium]